MKQLSIQAFLFAIFILVNSIITRYNYKQSEEFIWNTMKEFTKHAKKFNDTADVFVDRAEKWGHKVDSLKRELKPNNK